MRESRAGTPTELLATWEAGLAQHGPGRALLLHRAARPAAGTDELLSVPVGEREADLLRLRRSLFGDRMQVLIECERCGEAMEFDLDAGELAPAPQGRPGPLRVESDGWEVEFRLPTVADLVAVGDAAAAGGGRAMLLDRCTVSAVRAGDPVPAGQLPAPVQQRMADAVARADAAADVTLDVRCPECGEGTRAELDIASYLWSELDAWARDLLLDVHLLAGAYGWSEPEILALSPLRRRYYLELCADG
ncbi:T4 family baseplate hub assembly chaperone [Streptomyces sp. 8N706]|uniref:T4 family baseplate hub assembly chaperone n=1 Tax=Streptomyces sp. 8N706 TaxID=3457416 RepID=UPI003FCFACDF